MDGLRADRRKAERLTGRFCNLSQIYPELAAALSAVSPPHPGLDVLAAGRSAALADPSPERRPVVVVPPRNLPQKLVSRGYGGAPLDQPVRDRRGDRRRERPLEQPR